ncbi:MAG: nuclear transport factor 2 family protein [Planctomycetes bacterium]|nr:nuclear transport factor 2 family protein [Planctomycetota bacterium]
MRLIVLTALTVLTSNSTRAQTGGQTEYRNLKLANGARLRYALITPQVYEKRPNDPYPVLVAIPQGKQDEDMVELGLNTYWEREAKLRGWIVVSPMSPDGRFFHEGEKDVIPLLLDEIAKRFTVESGKFHLAGVGTGGVSAFHIAMHNPDRFRSLSVLPGFIESMDEQNKAAVLKDLSIKMYVGEKDYAWLPLMRNCHEALTKAGVDANLEVVNGEGHFMKIVQGHLYSALDGIRLAGGLGASHSGNEPSPVAAAEAVLDNFHDAASKADGERYFSHLTDNAVFLGTDPKERWTKAEFQKWANDHGYLKNGQGWTYVPGKRTVLLTPDGNSAWFDEVLKNETLGECRGTGVLVRTGEGDKAVWRIAQYNLSVPIPNDLSEEVVSKIRAFTPTGGGKPQASGKGQ